MCEEKIRCNTISSILCRVLLKLHVLDVYNLQWPLFVKETLNNIGLSVDWNGCSFSRQAVSVLDSR